MALSPSTTKLPRAPVHPQHRRQRGFPGARFGHGGAGGRQYGDEQGRSQAGCHLRWRRAAAHQSSGITAMGAWLLRGCLLKALTVGAGHRYANWRGPHTHWHIRNRGTGKVNIVNNAASQALGLATVGGGDNDNGATAAQTLDLNIDGVGPVHVDISGASDLADIASAIDKSDAIANGPDQLRRPLPTGPSISPVIPWARPALSM